MKTIFRRLREPSTWAGLAALMVALGLSADLADNIAAVGISVAGLLAVLLPDPNR